MSTVPMKTQIERKLQQALKIDYLEVIDESSNHNVPEGSESHFKVTIVTPEFDGKNLLAQHRTVNAILAEELAQYIHALALHTYTPAEWLKHQGISPESPPCLGGSAH